ncbi:5-formyltetrahydrofolate cyclo-ligase [Collibacillus ludicampi]|jgi:5-formyltetrahydrofolate cyclo-ligase|uniref:5-formyltetrahydrofolate cyclo-ligase n=1 Tax=Collibacillus ludicampi TaxID=2771369 RepID=A0AAV4LER5_9BACL|nr:5-formyltetrahydrofolate cyclo-ligase [Collibacillus ludicampi]GIM46319.1 5-formyltetrahydrofolate cyclo-ligase [Collibacillus ludicampi]
MDKTSIRKEILAKRQGVPKEIREEWDRKILDCIEQMDLVRKSSTIMLYFSFRAEVGTDEIFLWGIREGKRIAAPVTFVTERKLIPVEIRSLQDVVTGAYGIREPEWREHRVIPAEEIDLIFIPGVAFDRRGGRLGYGGGYYDRFLPQLRKDAVKIGLAYDLQIIDHVPAEPHDIILDGIVTESGWISSSREV